MAAVILPGVFGVLGVAVGATLTMLIELSRERRSDRRARLVAARMVARELATAHSAMTHAASTGTWWWQPLRTQEWETHGGTLAATLGNAEWETVDAAYRQVEIGERTREGGKDLDSDTMRDLQDAQLSLAAAVYSLAPFALGHHQPLPTGAIAAMIAELQVGAPAHPPPPEDPTE